MQSASFGFVIPECPVVFDTELSQEPPNSPTMSTIRWSYAIASSSNSTTTRKMPSSVWVFLTGNAPLPEGKVLSVYISDGHANSRFLFLGCLDNVTPSNKFIVPCGAFSTQFVDATASSRAAAVAGAPFQSLQEAAAASSSLAATLPSPLLGFCLENGESAMQQSATVAAASQVVHNDLVMRMGSAITAEMKGHIERHGAWLPDTNGGGGGGGGTIAVPSKIVDKCKMLLEKQVEQNITQFAA